MPEPYRIIMSPEAAADFESVHAYITQDSPAAAARMVERILAAIDTLTSFPHRTLAAHVSSRLRYPVRSLSVRPYVVYFRTLEDEHVVRILTVRHGARRRPRRL
jgi:plasmid stabilization system protein ParE